MLLITIEGVNLKVVRIFLVQKEVFGRIFLWNILFFYDNILILIQPSIFFFYLDFCTFKN
jgi:hypothetical protein